MLFSSAQRSLQWETAPGWSGSWPGLTTLSLPASLSTEEPVGISPTSPQEAKIPVARTSTSPEGGHGPQNPCEETLGTQLEPPAEVTPSESSESVSLVTQIVNPVTAPEAPVLPKDLSQKLLEASLEDQSPAADTGETGPAPPVPTKPPGPAGRVSSTEPRPPARVDILREEGPTDLRVFELNSDSGKSTPSNNGKKGRCEGAARGLCGRRASESCQLPRQTSLLAPIRTLEGASLPWPW